MLRKAVFSSRLFATVMLIAISASATFVCAQPLPPAESPVIGDGSTDEDTTPDQANANPPVVSLATGKALPMEPSPLHWGHLSMFSAEFLGAYDQRLTGTINEIFRATAIRTLLGYTVKTRKVSLDFQYLPSLWFSEGQYAVNLSSQNTTLGTTIRLAPTWTMRLSNSLAYYPDQGKLGDLSFTADYVIDSTTRNPYLSTGYKLFNETTDIGFSHALSGRDSLNFGVHYDYFRLFDLQSGQSVIGDYQGTRRHAVIGQIGWMRRLSSRSVFGVQYAEENRLYTDTDTTTYTHALFLTYGRDLGRTLHFDAGAGPTVQYGYLGGVNIGYRGSFSILKRLGHGDTAALAFVRDSSYNGITSDAMSNRVDLTYTHRFGRFARATGVFSDMRESYSASRGSFAGWSAGFDGAIYLPHSWQLFALYTHVNQANPSLNFGPHTIIAGGLRWSWETPK